MNGYGVGSRVRASPNRSPANGGAGAGQARPDGRRRRRNRRSGITDGDVAARCHQNPISGSAGANIDVGFGGSNLPVRSKYTGIFQATKDIFREEGLPGFWRGNVPALLMVVPYTAIQFTVLQKLKTIAAGSSKAEDQVHLSPYLSYLSGALAGCAATVGSYPFDLLRTILASQGEPKVYPNMRSALLDILRNRGFRGLYAGLTPTLIEIVPYAGLQFGTYDTFKRWTMDWNHNRSSKTGLQSQNDSLSSFQLFLCGLAAGTCAKLVCHPLDVVKKRFQIEGLPRHPRYGARVEPSTYRNMFDALNRIPRLEGWSGLYKGIVPSTIKAAPAGAVTFFVFELTSHWFESTYS